MKDVEKLFVPYFQKNISIYIENKLLRTGKLLLFSVKDFYLNFTFLTNNVTKSFELPYPFSAYTDSLSSHILILDYKTKTFARGLFPIELAAKKLYGSDKKMKFFDNVIKVVEII